MKQEILNLLGLAKKAGKIVSGEDSVLISLQRLKAKLVFVAKDASSQTIDKFDKKCFFYKVKMINDFDTNEISNAIGQERKVICLIDDGFAKAIKEKMEVQ